MKRNIVSSRPYAVLTATWASLGSLRTARLLVFCILFIDPLSNARADEPNAKQKQIRIAIYDHSTGTAKGPKNLLRFLTTDRGFAGERVTPDQIQAGILDDFDVLIMPGGSGSKQAKMLEDSGRDAVRHFVSRGGGYVGICAGSYLATSQYSWSLGLVNARVWDRAHWARGTGQVTISLTDPGRAVLNETSNSVDVYYGQGPLLVPDHQENLPGYEVLAIYSTEVAKRGAPQGAMMGTHAIIRTRFGRGNVICFSPHPEVKEGPNQLMEAGVRWAAGSNITRSSTE